MEAPSTQESPINTPSQSTVNPSFYKGSRRVVIALGLFAVTILAVAGFWFFPQCWSAYTLPQELKGALLLSSKGSETTAYVPQTFCYKKMPYRGGNTSAFTRQERNIVLTVRKEDQEYILEENGVERIRETLPIATPSLEPSSGRIIYAQAVKPEMELETKLSPQTSTVDPSHYEVRVYFPSSGKTERIISGYAPLFLDDTNFLFFVGSGVYRYNLTSGTAEKVLDQTFSSVFGPVLQSPDRTLVLIKDPLKRMTSVYRVTETGLTLVTQIPRLLISPTLSNDALYEVEGGKQEGHVWKYTFDTTEPQLIHTFPSTLSIIRVVF